MKRTVCAVVLLTLLACNLAGAATKYVIKDLGILPGTKDSIADAINNKGQIVGTSQILSWAADGKTPVSHAFLWQNGRMTEITIPGKDQDILFTDISDSGRILIGTNSNSFIVQGVMAKKIEGLPGYPIVVAAAINNRGDVVGRCENAKGLTVPFIRRNGIMKALPTPPESHNVYGMALNERGQAAGTVEEFETATFCLLWEDGKMRSLGGAAHFSIVADISEDGTIVGEHYSEGDDQAFVLRNGRQTFLKAPKGLRPDSAQCINSKGVIAGACTTEKQERQAVAWDSDGVPHLLASLGGTESWANDINDAGVIVGVSEDKDGNYRAVMWTPVK